MKKIGAFLVFIALHSFAIAQVNSEELRKKLASEIIAIQNTATDLPNLFNKVATITSLQAVSALRIKNKDLSDVQLKRAERVFEEVLANEMQIMMGQTLPKINEATLTLFMQNFNLEEIQELHRFYLSPAGMKVLRVTMQELPNLMSSIMPDATVTGQKIISALQKAYAQLDSEGIKLRK